MTISHFCLDQPETSAGIGRASVFDSVPESPDDSRSLSVLCESLPARFGKYELRRLLSAGGQGRVYDGWDPDLQRQVAIKIALSDAGERLDSYSPQGEGACLARLDHPHLARVFDCGVLDSISFLVLEFVPGTNLKELSQLRQLPTRFIERILEQLADAVSACHRAGILHLDIKPENVMVTPEGVCKLLDFGLGRSLADSRPSCWPLVMGTSGYLAPEQLRGQSFGGSPACDVYGLGAVLFFLLTHAAPGAVEEMDAGADSQSASERVGRLLDQAPAHLRAICQRALEANPQARFETAEEFRNAIRRRRRFRERLCAVVVIVLGAVLLAAGICLWAIDQLREHDHKQRSAAQESSSGPSGLAFQFEIATDPPNLPEALFWTPGRGACPIQGLVRHEQQGLVNWKPASREGILAGSLSKNQFCLLAWTGQAGREPAHMKSLLEKSARALLRGCETETAPETLLLTSGGRCRLPGSADSSFVSSVRQFQAELDRLQIPYACLLAVRRDDGSPTWALRATLPIAASSTDSIRQPPEK